jgi:hypothetical protein
MRTRCRKTHLNAPPNGVGGPAPPPETLSPQLKSFQCGLENIAKVNHEPGRKLPTAWRYPATNPFSSPDLRRIGLMPATRHTFAAKARRNAGIREPRCFHFFRLLPAGHWARKRRLGPGIPWLASLTAINTVRKKKRPPRGGLCVLGAFPLGRDSKVLLLPAPPRKQTTEGKH